MGRAFPRDALAVLVYSTEVQVTPFPEGGGATPEPLGVLNWFGRTGGEKQPPEGTTEDSAEHLLKDVSPSYADSQ